MEPLKYIFQKAMPTGILAKWKMLLSEEYEPLKTYFHDEEVSFIGEDIYETYPGWRPFLDGAANHQGKGIGAVSNLIARTLGLNIKLVHVEWAVKNPNNIPYVHYVQKLCKRFSKIEFKHTPRIQNELVDALATIAFMIKHPDTDYIDPLNIELKEHAVHC
ncbi:uncharacterized protein [Solanum lycopersicum]|uniref:uncharacterized protein n=1 Tax=Solanum lycopersicum TaxID=4081 RepID=UPI00374997F4